MGVSAGMKFTAAATLTCLTCSQGLLMEVGSPWARSRFENGCRVGQPPYTLAANYIMRDINVFVANVIFVARGPVRDFRKTFPVRSNLCGSTGGPCTTVPPRKWSFDPGCSSRISMRACTSIRDCASKEHGKYPYNVATVPLMSELFKLILSTFLLYQQYSKDPKATQVGVLRLSKFGVRFSTFKIQGFTTFSCVTMSVDKTLTQSQKYVVIFVIGQIVMPE
eukprot:1202631-Pyramimonas_sp.AAC.2